MISPTRCSTKSACSLDMALLRLSLACFLFGTCFAASSENFSSDFDKYCSITYRNIGCYNDHHFSQRPLKERLQLDYEERSCPDENKIASNEAYAKEWNEYMYNLVCKCAAKAKELEYDYFGIEDCGQCWAAKDFLVNVNGMSDKCATYNMEDCAFNSDICIGKSTGSIYAYNIAKRRRLFGK